MKELPVGARVYVGVIIAAGAVVLALFAPHTVARPSFFIALLLCSSLASAFKVTLPLASSGSTMSVSYAVDFAALLMLGADETMIVAAVSAWSHSERRAPCRAAATR